MYLEDSCYDRFERRIAACEENGASVLASRITALETPVASVGSALPTDLNTALVLGLLTAVAPALNSTNNRVNSIASRVNAIQSAMVSKGLMAA